MSDEEAQVPKKEPTVYDRLAERFDAKHHKTKTIGGTTLTYVDGEMVVSRLNEELGLGGWSFEVKDVKVLEDEVWALGRITVYGPDRTIVREQAGGQIINRKRGTPAQPARAAQEADGDRPAIPAVEAQPAVKGEVIELSNDIKGAITDCLKKCATLLGVGLYLFNPDERREVEAEMREAKRNPQPKVAAPPTPIRDAAVLTGAVPIADPVIYQCLECNKDVAAGSTLNIQKNDKKQRVSVSVEEFYPVCEARLGGFHCAACYDKKFWGAA